MSLPDGMIGRNRTRRTGAAATLDQITALADVARAPGIRRDAEALSLRLSEGGFYLAPPAPSLAVESALN
jgi:hypothetical protein